MYLKCIWVMLCVCGLACMAAAQEVFKGQLLTRTAAPNSAFRYKELADSCLRISYMGSAAAYFQKIDAYYLLSAGVTPANAEDECQRYGLTPAAQKAFITRFNAVYAQPRNEAYSTLLAMEQGYMELAARYGAHSSDAGERNKIAAEMRTANHRQNEWLYKYVKKNGWPDLAHGALFTGHIAEGDAAHWCFYAPILAKAVLAGNADYTLANTILNNCAHPDAEALRKTYTHGATFDLSGILNGTRPTDAQMIEMQTVIAEKGPARYLLVQYQAADGRFAKLFEDEYNISMEGAMVRSVLRQLAGYQKRQLPYSDAPLTQIAQGRADKTKPAALVLYMYY